MSPRLALAALAALAWSPSLWAGDCEEYAPQASLSHYVGLAVQSYSAGDRPGLYSAVRDVEQSIDCANALLNTATVADAHYAQGLKHQIEGDAASAEPYFCATRRLFPDQNWPRYRGFGDESLIDAWAALSCDEPTLGPIPPAWLGELSVDGAALAHKPRAPEGLPIVLQHLRFEELAGSAYVHPGEEDAGQYVRFYSRLGLISAGLGGAGLALFGVGQWRKGRLEAEVEDLRVLEAPLDEDDAGARQLDWERRQELANRATVSGVIFIGAGLAGGGVVGYSFFFR